jgi:hypothetical protein
MEFDSESDHNSYSIKVSRHEKKERGFPAHTSPINTKRESISQESSQQLSMFGSY